MARHSYHPMCGCAQCCETERARELDDEMRDQYQDDLIECSSFIAELALENEEAESIATAVRTNNLREIGMAFLNALYRAADEMIVTRADESGISPGEAAERLYKAHRPQSRNEPAPQLAGDHMNTKWYHFNQNNSGGSFVHDADAGIGANVWVEARTLDEASARAQDNGLYFDGVREGVDCPCCGDRWHEPSIYDASDNPKWYGDTVRPAKDGEEPTIYWGIPSYAHPLEGPFYAVVREETVMGNWTPGPWEVVENPDSGGGDTAISNAASIYSECETYVADVYRGYVGSENVTAASQSANARLIAAAPELLEACQALLEATTEDGITEAMLLGCAIEMAGNAVAKATGVAHDQEHKHEE